MHLAAEHLKSLGACSQSVDTFQGLFPRGVKVTEALCLQYGALFDWDWAAQHLLSSEGQAAYREAKTSARAAFDEAMAKALDPYREAQTSAWLAFNEIRDSAQVAYRETLAPARATFGENEDSFNEAQAAAWATFKGVLAPAHVAFDEAMAAARAAYCKLKAAAQVAFDEAMARAFGCLAEKEDHSVLEGLP